MPTSSKPSYTKRPFDASLMLGSGERGMVGIIARRRTHDWFLFLFGLLESESVSAFSTTQKRSVFLEGMGMGWILKGWIAARRWIQRGRT